MCELPWPRTPTMATRTVSLALASPRVASWVPAAAAELARKCLRFIRISPLSFYQPIGDMIPRYWSLTLKIHLICAIAAVCGLTLLIAEEPSWAPKAVAPTKYTPPHKPHTKLADLRALHSGKKDWRHVVVDDDHLHGEYILAAPGNKVGWSALPSGYTRMVGHHARPDPV